ncbi:unnamed protein product [Clonostachys chloroleuca]|uniref:Uncharacterized protein n=1 Tax=Clonostachys chloroleuca TaxID=1926264 RepID=A0AA35Q453_9HYPO|nr:unnamed protein product [Clonostachys chloroleuca]
MEEDETEWEVLTIVEHEPEERINEMSDAAVKFYEYSKINPSNQRCKKLGVMSKSMTELIESFKETMEEDELYHGCPVYAAEIIMEARQIVRDGAPHLIDRFDAKLDEWRDDTIPVGKEAREATQAWGALHA